MPLCMCSKCNKPFYNDDKNCIDCGKCSNTKSTDEYYIVAGLHPIGIISRILSNTTDPISYTQKLNIPNYMESFMPALSDKISIVPKLEQDKEHASRATKFIRYMLDNKKLINDIDMAPVKEAIELAEFNSRKWTNHRGWEQNG